MSMKDYGLQWMIRDKKERWFKEIKKTLKMIIIVEETNYTQMIKQFFEVFRLSKIAKSK